MSVERTPYGLRGALFDLLDNLRDGSVSHKDARVQCEVAKQIIDTGRLELASIQAAKAQLELAHQLEAGPKLLADGREEE